MRRTKLLNVFLMSMATVMGPTPPGTGVICEATSRASSKHTSPHIRGRGDDDEEEEDDDEEEEDACGAACWDESSSNGTMLKPTSTTTAPGLIQWPFTSPGEPAAVMSTSAARQAASRSPAALLQRHQPAPARETGSNWH